MKAVRILERVLTALPMSILMLLLVFAFVRLLPGDPVDIMMGQAGNVSQAEIDALRRELHLDRPLAEQLSIFVRGLLRGDLGYSFREQRPVAAIIGEAFPATVELALAGLTFALLVGLPIGVVSAVKRNSWFDRLAMGFSFLGISMPAFWLGIMAMMLFSVHLGWTPVQGRLSAGLVPPDLTGFYVLDALLTRDWALLKDALRHLVLPAVTLGAELTAIIARVTRSSMLEALHMDYVTAARSRGVPEWQVVLRHALRNALIPTVTVTGLQLGVLLGGNMIVETVFGWPGLGRLVVGAIFARDYALVQGAVMLYALTFLLANLLVDILYTQLNPKLEL
ncbi:ABC transporter permease [Symbiobacterium thermophilum]|uniref:ABC transporter permease n=1 Tax=Symbiobacterium thermophilum TaxID=2734 RepID=UPI0035C6629C